MDDFSLARPAGHLIMGDGSGPDDLATKDGAKALSGAASVDTATTQLDKPSRTKNSIIELEAIIQLLEQPSDGVVAHLVALLREGLGEMTGAFAGAKQR